MLRKVRWTLRQPRYAALAAFMLVVAAICVAAGTWQISRFGQSVRDNNALKGNAHAAAVPLTTALVPIVGQAATPGRNAIRYRTVTVSGSYVPGAQQFVRNESLDGVNGYDLLNPVRTDAGVLLVVRGFVAGSTGAPPASVTAPPVGPVRIAGRLQTSQSENDAADKLGNSEIESINPAEQAVRLGTPVYDAYLTLTAGQPGTSGVKVLPDPDLSNPAGGAYEGQHFAYIVQWYLFALLALAAPFLIARSEVRAARRNLLGIGADDEQFDLELEGPQDQQLQLPSGAEPGGAVAVRGNGTLARRGEPTPEQWQRAARLADRYGRSLGVGHDVPVDGQAVERRPAGPPRRIGGVPATAEQGNRVPDNATRPYRSHDAYHGAYNDHLWQLALADGDIPTVEVPGPEPVDDPPSPATDEP